MVGNDDFEGEAKQSFPECSGTCAINETSPDSLKNTPTNIARLEDVIEHSKGRQKYLAQTRSPSDGGDVRWYFCKVPFGVNELAASIPCTEIVGKSDYFRFGMRDSLAIEASFLQREEELLSSWWREYAECSEGPRKRSSSSTKLDSQPKASSLEGAPSAQPYVVEEERVGVPVKGGLYEVDLVKRHCFPVYWNGENRRVLRGHWFARKGGLNWLPLREDVSEQLEFAYRSQVWHRRTFQPSGLFAARVDLQGSTPGLHALFTGEDDSWEAWLNLDASVFSSVISFGGNAIKLRRGYSTSQSSKPTQDELRQQMEEEMDDYCSQVPVRHLVFMVHGIGQRLEKSNLVDDVGNFRHITARLAELHLSSYQRGAQRVLFIPCQWRRGLKLSGETTVEKITLDGVRGLRVMLSATVHDVLYYMSPIHCQDIINSVSNQLNRLYLKFLKRNPGYDGKVSIYGHSLGSVLSYDILCHQENLSSPFPMDWMYNERVTNEESPDVTNQSTKFNSSINLEEKSLCVSNKCAGALDHVNDAQMDAQTAQLVQKEGCFKVPSISLALPVRSNLEEASEQAMDAKQIDSILSSEEDAHELVCDSIGILPQLGDDFNETANIVSGVPVDNSENADLVYGGASDKEKATELLMKEIDSLKARIAELESPSAAKDTSTGVHTTMPKETSHRNLSPALDDAPKSCTPYIKYTKLEFKVDTFFAVGSPLGVFLSLRNVRIGIGKGHEYWGEEYISEEMPACRKMFNIFHPFDPVAYRIEPLVCKEYIGKRPVIIPYHKGGKRLHIGFQDFTEDLAARSQAIMDHLNSIKVLTVCQTRNMDSLEDSTENAQEREERSYGSIMMERLTGSENGRIDHMLQDKTFEHAYISAIGSHTNYWRDYDTALFILKHLYQDIPEPNSPESRGSNSKNESSLTDWSDHRDAVSEEIPLTFSDKVLIKSFSQKAKKIMKKP
ncbi:phospholipase SGR2 isoform X2 [Malania oleifera]|uniref:phospholipase SGR2 isoform X2 n=1 Tax=Malania oleifera TaxID=397392 RepID=UPI0025AE2770|nr:phospholipase SGR2 isoform X2 [Malania oleifera]